MDHQRDVLEALGLLPAAERAGYVPADPPAPVQPVGYKGMPHSFVYWSNDATPDPSWTSTLSGWTTSGYTLVLDAVDAIAYTGLGNGSPDCQGLPPDGTNG